MCSITEWEILDRYCWLLSLSAPTSEEALWANSLREKAKNNPALKQDPLVLWSANTPQILMWTGYFAFAYNDGRVVTDSDIHEHAIWARDIGLPLLRQAHEQSVGARKEWVRRLMHAAIQTHVSVRPHPQPSLTFTRTLSWVPGLLHSSMVPEKM